MPNLKQTYYAQADAVINVHCEMTNLKKDDTALVDILVNLKIWAKGKDYNFDEALHLAHVQFEQDVKAGRG